VADGLLIKGQDTASEGFNENPFEALFQLQAPSSLRHDPQTVANFTDGNGRQEQR